MEITLLRAYGYWCSAQTSFYDVGTVRTNSCYPPSSSPFPLCTLSCAQLSTPIPIMVPCGTVAKAPFFQAHRKPFCKQQWCARWLWRSTRSCIMKQWAEQHWINEGELLIKSQNCPSAIASFPKELICAMEGEEVQCRTWIICLNPYSALSQSRWRYKNAHVVCSKTPCKVLKLIFITVIMILILSIIKIENRFGKGGMTSKNEQTIHPKNTN